MPTLEHPMLMLRTSVSQKLQKKLLRRGISCIFTGLGVLWLADILSPFAGIEDLGIWRWVASGGILGVSYYPYRQALHYKFSPEVLKITKELLILTRTDLEVIRLPWKHIEDIRFIEDETSYGIAFSLKPQAEESPAMHSLRQQSKKHYGVDLFLPFFSESSCRLLKNWQEHSRENNG
jgi:hypothetical protein